MVKKSVQSQKWAFSAVTLGIHVSLKSNFQNIQIAIFLFMPKRRSVEIQLVLSNLCFYLPASRLSIARGMFSISMHTQSPLLPHQIFQTDGQARKIVLIFKCLPNPSLPGVMCSISIIPRVNEEFQLGNAGLHKPGMLV